jgi:small-conductance mechanosensitive channel
MALGLVSVLCVPAFAQAAPPRNLAPSQSGELIAIENTGVPVEVDGRPILRVYAPIGGLTAQERADAIEGRIINLGKNKTITVDAIHAEGRETWTEIIAGGDRIMGVTQADAEAAERPRAELAAEYVGIIRQVIREYRNEHTARRFMLGLLYSLAATLAYIAGFVLMFKLRQRFQARVDEILARREPVSQVHMLGAKLAHYLGQPLLTISRITFWILVLVWLQAYVTVVLRFFPSTKYASHHITNWVFSALSTFGRSVVAYIPNLILLGCICFVTATATKVTQFVFGEIRDERLTLHGFYPDWAEPTAKLIRTLILIAAIIVAFPYLPGSESPAFKGISVFLGLLLSLGSTSAVAHAVSGTILTYMRAFQVGDFVRIGTDVGEVLEKTLLVTRIRTQKNEVITIPNGTVLGGVVMNYSAEGRRRGVIFHTVVTIGYSAAWRQVHSLLISAALATEDILHDPPPFVLQTALNDFYVSYELNAYTAKPMRMMNIYSTLHQNIQDNFNQAGVEINSPHYMSLRDGNETTIPHNYLPQDYRHPVFEFQQSANAVPQHASAGPEK